MRLWIMSVRGKRSGPDRRAQRQIRYWEEGVLNLARSGLFLYQSTGDLSRCRSFFWHCCRTPSLCSYSCRVMRAGRRLLCLSWLLSRNRLVGGFSLPGRGRLAGRRGSRLVQRRGRLDCPRPAMRGGWFRRRSDIRHLDAKHLGHKVFIERLAGSRALL